MNSMRTLMVERAKIFRAAYTKLSADLFFEEGDQQSFHNGEYGGYRERLVTSFLKSFLSPRYSFGEGFLINSKGGRSRQTDIVIYDANETPRLEDQELRRFYPIECTHAAGSVKSKLKKSTLIEALNVLMETKLLREVSPESYPVWPPEALIGELAIGGREWLPSEYEDQNIVTFLVCESIEGLGSEGLLKFSNTLYDKKMSHITRRHNLILSLRDGYLGYFYTYGNEKRSYPFPQRAMASTGYQWVKPTRDGAHIIQFAHDLSLALSIACVYPFSGHAYIPQSKRTFAPMG